MRMHSQEVRVTRYLKRFLPMALLFGSALTLDAQRQRDLASSVTARSLKDVTTPRRGTLLTVSVADAVSTPVDISGENRGPRWPRYALYGAGIGTVVGVAAVIILDCDEECRTSGAGRWGRLIGLPLAAAAGAVGGALAGVIVDAAR